MRNKIFAAFVSLFILVVFLSAPVVYVLSQNDIITVDNVGNIIKVENTYDDSFVLAPFFNGIEEVKRAINDIYINYIPGYVPITTVTTSIFSSINSGITDALGNWGNVLIKDSQNNNTPSDPTEPPVSQSVSGTFDDIPSEPEIVYNYSTSLLSKDSNHRFYRIVAKDPDGVEKIFFCRVPAISKTKLKKNSADQIEMINSMADARPDINFYVYIPTCLEDTALGTEILPSESTKTLFDNFISSMSENVNLDYLKYDTLDERYEMFFATDHHWNRYGSYQGYCDIIAMMQKNYDDFGEPRDIVKDYAFDAKLYGSLALGINNYDFYDPFGVLDLGLPKHSLVVNSDPGYGGSAEFYAWLERYKEGRFSKSKSYNHFMEFYRIARTIEYPENNTGRNLLLIGDSFSTCIAEAIASHFDKTIVRYVDSTNPRNINYSDYIDENNITDVLILETSSRVVLNLYEDSLNNIKVGGSK